MWTWRNRGRVNSDPDRVALNAEDVVSIEDLSDELVEWMRLTSGFILVAVDSVYHVPSLNFERGETSILIERTTGGWLRLWKAYRRGRPVWDYDVSELRFAEKRIALEVGDSIRSERVGGPLLDVGECVGKVCAPGFQCEQGVLADVLYEGEPMRVEVLKFGGVPVGRFRAQHLRSDAAAASYYFNEDLSTIIASLLAPDGRPLFSPLRQG